MRLQGLQGGRISQRAPRSDGAARNDFSAEAKQKASALVAHGPALPSSSQVVTTLVFGDLAVVLLNPRIRTCAADGVGLTANSVLLESLTQALVKVVVLCYLGSTLSLYLMVIASRANSIAKESKGSDHRAAGPRKASEDATLMPEIGATALFGTSKRFARFALLMLVPAHASAITTAITKANICTAVTTWPTSPTTATYGNIVGLNIAAVTSMTSLFYPASTARPTALKANIILLPCAQALAHITNANIAAAVTDWVSSPSTVATTYGPIADWNTAAVMSMYQRFMNLAIFNDDLHGFQAETTDTFRAAPTNVRAPADVQPKFVVQRRCSRNLSCNVVGACDTKRPSIACHIVRCRTRGML
jgi:hypothetical protein